MARQIRFEIIGDERDGVRAFQRTSQEARKFQGTITGVSSGINRALAGIGVGIGIASIITVAKGAVGAASDLEEQLSKTDVVFGKSAAAISDWSKTTAAAFGLSQRAALEASAGFGQILETSGLTETQAARFSRRLTELASDIASFNNIDPSEALDKLRSGLVGEAEPLRRVGVLLSEARVKQAAYAAGIAASGDELTEGQKVQARYMLILQDTATAQGDFGRTSESLANQQRILTANVENLRAKLGQALLPAITGIVTGVNQWLASSENQRRVQDILAQSVDNVGKAVGAFRDIIGGIAPVVQGAVRSLGGLNNALKLLASLFIASRVIRFADALGVFSTSATTATKRAALLRTALLRLGAIGIITIGVEVLLNKDEINARVNDFLRSHNLGFFTGLKIDIPVNWDEAKLTQFRNEISGVKGETDLLVKALDQVIARKRIAAATKIVAPGEERQPAPSRTVEAPTKVRDEVTLLPGIQKFLDLINVKIPAATKRLASEAAEQAKSLIAMERASDAAALAVDRYRLALDQAAATPTLRDDIEALRAIGTALDAQEAAVRRQLAAHKDNLDLQRQLVSIQGEQISNEQALAAAVRERAENQRRARAGREQASQFRKLGLTAAGDEPIPGVEGLRKRLGGIDDAIEGTFLDTSKTRSLLSRIRQVLSGGLGKVGNDVRSKIKEILDGIDNDLRNRSEGPLTKFHKANTRKMLEGIGLSADQIKELQARLSRVGSGGMVAAGSGGGAFGQATPAVAAVGGGNFFVTGPITVIADDPDEFAKALERKDRRNGSSRRGTNPGRRGGV